MTQYDTFKAQIEVTYTRPHVEDPQEQALSDTDMFFEEPSELMKVIRSGFDDDSIEIVVNHETVDLTASQAEVEAIREKFEVDDGEDWG